MVALATQTKNTRSGQRVYGLTIRELRVFWFVRSLNDFTKLRVTQNVFGWSYLSEIF